MCQDIQTLKDGEKIKMNKCKCGRTINLFSKYCEFCKKSLSLREKVLEAIRGYKI